MGSVAERLSRRAGAWFVDAGSGDFDRFIPSVSMLVAIYATFVLMVMLLVLLDLGVLTRESHVISAREAGLRTLGWMSLALLFNVFVYHLYGRDLFGWRELTGHQLTGSEAAVQFFTGYLLEQSLSVDNMMVIAIIFGYFRIPLADQHRVLFWGIVGALVLRGAMIAAGVALIHRFDWIIDVFGGLLILTALKLLLSGDQQLDPERSFVYRIARRIHPIAPRLEGRTFFTTLADGRRAMTPMFLALLLVETSDVIFAVDSIPAVFAVTRDPFLVFTSNVFAILGLRSLYFALAGFLDKFRYLKLALVFILAFVGIKMIVNHHLPSEREIPTPISLLVIVGILAAGVTASVLHPKSEDPGEEG